MYSYNELSAVELSPTKKDYYQIWNELLDTASKISERWDPSTTNESDPGVVLLKVLTAVADKLSYNIDANTLEAFMPSAAQESSMRKLCEMLGYTMRFYRSATTQVRITYAGDVFPKTLTGIINIGRFTNIKSTDGTINYITKEPIQLSPAVRSMTVECIEGSIVTCETDLGSRVVFEHLDDNKRFYLPEHQIASNGIYVCSIDSADQSDWQQVDNLNTCSLGSRVFKFGYDSTKGVPFLQFPEDVSSLIGTGLYIRFIRTNGIKGNVALNTLKVLEPPASWSEQLEETTGTLDSETLIEGETSDGGEWKDPNLYIVSNLSAAVDGKDPETIDEAYWNFQKTIGTFDTLVTCRDYMNKIYQFTRTSTSDLPLVSNVIVSDIRDDINRAYSINTLTTAGPTTMYKVHQKPKFGGKEGETEDSIHYFDLMLYPFVAINNPATKEDYASSFTYTDETTIRLIESYLHEQKTIAHKFVIPESEEIACIKAYFQLSARLATSERITTLEAEEISLVAHKALYREFNMRKISFGEELPFDLILKTLLNSHTKIKSVNLDDPKIYLVVCTVGGKEYPITGDHVFSNLNDAKTARNFYLDLTLKNALAGKLPLFNFNQNFKASLDLAPYPTGLAATTTTASKFNGKPENLIKPVLVPGLGVATKTLDLKESDGRTLYHMSPEVGTCTLSIRRKEYVSSNSSFYDLIKDIREIEIMSYGPAEASPTYRLIYTPNSTCTSLVGVVLPEVINRDFSFVPEIVSVSHDLFSFCNIYYNNQALEALVDKISFKVTLKDESADPGVEIVLTWAESNDALQADSSAISLDFTELTKDGLNSPCYIFNDNTSAEKDTPTIEGTLPLLLPEGAAATIRSYPSGVIPTISPKSYKNISYKIEANAGGNLAVNAYFEDEAKIELGTLHVNNLGYWAFSSAFGSECDLKISEDSYDEDTLDTTFLEIKICSLGFAIKTADNYSNSEVRWSYYFFNNLDNCTALDFVRKPNSEGNGESYSFSKSQLKTVEVLAFILGIEDTLENSTPNIPYLAFDTFGNTFAAVTFEGSDSSGSGASWDCDELEEKSPVSTVTYNAFTEDSSTYTAIDKNSKDGLTLKQVDEPLPKIVAVETEFRVDTTQVSPDEPLILKENEVIQFRAPNFKTVATYPGYINYYFKYNAQGITNTPAIPATMQTLAEFFNGGPTGYIEGALWNKEISWNEKISSLLATDPTYETYEEEDEEEEEAIESVPEAQTYTLRAGTTAKPTTTKAKSKFMVECFKTGNKYGAGTAEETLARSQLAKYTKKYGTLFTNGVKVTYPDLNDKNNDSGAVKYTVVKHAGFHAFVIPKAPKGTEFDIPKNIQFYGLKIDSSTFAAASAWLQGRAETGNGIGGTEPGKNITNILRENISAMPISDLERYKPRKLADLVVNLDEKPIKGFYTKGNANISKKPGHLIDANSCSYELMNVVPEEVSFDDIYVPILWEKSADTHTADGLGTSALYRGLPADSEYALKAGEYLLINYSSSAGREDGTAVVKNVAYGEGTIIKPNFQLLSSIDQLNIAPYTKTSDFGPWVMPDKSVISSTSSGGALDGMFTLGATDKIEIRERIQVVLEEANAELFWELNSPHKDSDGNEYLFAPGVYAYTLQAGEYLYYTDSSKEAMAYYGSGTEIVRDLATPEIRRQVSDSKIFADQVNKLGLIAAIPWRPVNLSGQNASLTINEYQYVNLIAEDSLTSIALAKDSSPILGAGWQTVETATYKISETEGTLPTFLIDDCKWAVSSRLDLAVGPALPQTLNVHQNSLGKEVARDIIKLYGLDTQTSPSQLKLKETQVYTPTLAAVSAEIAKKETISDLELVEDTPIEKLTKVEFKFDSKDEDTSTLVFKPTLPQDMNWQTAYGQYLIENKFYYLQVKEFDSITADPCLFIAETHAYELESVAGIFNTPGHAAKLFEGLTVDLTGEYSYPRLCLDLNDAAFADCRDDISELKNLTCAFYSKNEEDLTIVSASGKEAVPLTLYADTYLVSDQGKVNLIDPTSGEAEPISFKAGYKKPLVLSDGSTFASLANKTTPIPLGVAHVDAHMPVVEFSILVPKDSFGMLTILVGQGKSNGTENISLVTNKPLAIFNNESSSQSLNKTGTNAHEWWTWWRGCTRSAGNSNTEYTLRIGVNTIIIPESSTLKLFAPARSALNLSVGDLKLIYSEKPFNTQLAYGTTGALFAVDPLAASETARKMTTDERKELLNAQNALEALIAEQVAKDDAEISEQDSRSLLDAITQIAQAKRAIADTIVDLGEQTESKLIANTSYPCLYINDQTVLDRLKALDSDLECYYSDLTQSSYGIELNSADSTDTMLLAKNWFDKRNIANKFIVPEIATANNHLEDYVVVSKTSIL